MPKAAAKKKTSRVSKKTVKANSSAPKAAAARVSKPKANFKTTVQNRLESARKNFLPIIRNPRVFIPLIIIVLAVLLYVFRSAFIVATVNGQPISRIEFNNQLQQQAGKQVMNSLVTQTLIEQEASRRHVSVSQSEIDNQVKTISSQLATQGQTLDSALAARGMTLSALQEQIKLQLLIQKMLGNKVSVSDKEITDYINQNKDSIQGDPNSAAVKDQIKQQLQQQKLSQEAQALVQQLESKAQINYFINL